MQITGPRVWQTGTLMFFVFFVFSIVCVVFSRVFFGFSRVFFVICLCVLLCYLRGIPSSCYLQRSRCNLSSNYLLLSCIVSPLFSLFCFLVGLPCVLCGPLNIFVFYFVFLFYRCDLYFLLGVQCVIRLFRLRCPVFSLFLPSVLRVLSLKCFVFSRLFFIIVPLVFFGCSAKCCLCSAFVLCVFLLFCLVLSLGVLWFLTCLLYVFPLCSLLFPSCSLCFSRLCVGVSVLCPVVSLVCFVVFFCCVFSRLCSVFASLL